MVLLLFHMGIAGTVECLRLQRWVRLRACMRACARVCRIYMLVNVEFASVCLRVREGMCMYFVWVGASVRVRVADVPVCVRAWAWCCMYVLVE